MAHWGRAAGQGRWARAAGAAPPAATNPPGGPASVRSVLSLLAGIAISVAGVLVVVRSPYDIAGVLLITAGVVVAVLVPMTSPQRSRS